MTALLKTPAAFFSLVIACSVIAKQFLPEAPPPQPAAVVQKPAPTEKQILELARLQKEVDRREFARAVARTFKNNMRDPQSFVVYWINTNRDGTAICMEFGARNGFGGMNREMLVVDAKGKVRRNVKCPTETIDQPIDIRGGWLL